VIGKKHQTYITLPNDIRHVTNYVNETWGESIKQNCWIWWSLTINTNKFDI